MHCLLELDSKKSSLRAAHGYLSFVSKGKVDSMTNTANVFTKIKRRAVCKDHIPKKAIVPNAQVHVNIADVNSTNLFDAYAIFIYNLAVLSPEGTSACRLQ